MPIVSRVMRRSSAAAVIIKKAISVFRVVVSVLSGEGYTGMSPRPSSYFVCRKLFGVSAFGSSNVPV